MLSNAVNTFRRVCCILCGRCYKCCSIHSSITDIYECCTVHNAITNVYEHACVIYGELLTE